MPITQIITELPEAPDPAIHGLQEFPIVAAASVLAQKGLPPQLNAFATQANALELNVNEKEASTVEAATIAGQAAAIAIEKAAAAESSALAAVNAPGTSGTSATNLTVGAGTKSLITQVGKNWIVGQPVVISRTSAPATTRMAGVITAYNSGTGAMDISVSGTGFLGAGDFADWTIALAGSGDASLSPRRIVQLKVMDDTTGLTAGDGKVIFCVPFEFDGAVLVQAESYITTASSAGLPTVQIRNVTTGLDMLSTKASIDVGEFTSFTAAAPAVVNAANATVAKGDRIAVDIDVAGTGAKGLGVILSFQKA